MATKMIPVKDLTAGDVLADAVISLSGKVLLGKGITLTQRHITLLNTWDVKSVFICTEEEEPVEELPQEEPQPAKIILPQQEMQAPEYFQFVHKYNSVIVDTAQTFDFIKKQHIVPVSHLKNTAVAIHSSIVANSFEIMNYLLLSNNHLANYISRHSVLVAYFAGMIARQMKWNNSDAAGVALAGLLHDVGNLVADKTDNPSTQAHIAEAARLLKETKGLANEVILGIIQHREPVNSTGQITGINGSKIHPYAKIIAVADFFHNLAYTDTGVNPFPVLDALTAEMFGKLDPDVCQVFINRVKDSLLNSKVFLSDGHEAEVIFFRPSEYKLPIVKTDENKIIDLSQHKGLTISRIKIPS